MKKIIIDEKRPDLRDRIQAELDVVQQRAHVRTIDVDDLLDELVEITQRLGITKKAMEGVKVFMNPCAQKFPGRYKGIPVSTWVEAIFKRGHWQVTSIYRDECSNNRFEVKHTEASRAAIIAAHTIIKGV